MGILLWVVFGLIAGAIAKYLMPRNAQAGSSPRSSSGSSGRWSAGFLARCSGSGTSPVSICEAWPWRSEVGSLCF